jgi:hypothetical protein
VTEEEFVRLNYEHYSRLFPKACTNCGRRFETLRDYILVTRPIGATISYDAELGEWQTTEPLGAAALANCPCGSTVALTTAGIPLADIQRMLEWIKEETGRRGITSAALLGIVRNEIRKLALADPADERRT